MVTIEGNELQAWVETTSQKWKDFLLTDPQVLSLPCDLHGTRTVAEFLQHIVAVELRYAQYLLGTELTPWEEIPCDSVESIYRTHDLAMSLIETLADKEEEFWAEWVDFSRSNGTVIRIPRRTTFIHLLMHSIRHYAQLATLVRQQGHPADMALDYIIMRPIDPLS